MTTTFTRFDRATSQHAYAIAGSVAELVALADVTEFCADLM
jgi:hypothetical protein